MFNQCLENYIFWSIIFMMFAFYNAQIVEAWPIIKGHIKSVAVVTLALGSNCH